MKMEQIYKTFSELIILNRGLKLFRDSQKTTFSFNNKFDELTRQQRTFVYIMVAASPHGEIRQRYDYVNKKGIAKRGFEKIPQQLESQLLFKMQQPMYTSEKLYHIVRQQLIDKHVIKRIGNTHKYVLNPEFHPSLTGYWIELLEEIFSEQAHKMVNGNAAAS